MKKQLQFLVLLAAFLLPLASQAQVVVTSSSPFVESFEETSTTRAGWSQIFVSGSHQWTFGAGAHSSSPISTAYAGSTNARFIHTSNGTQTKLVSPVLDLSSLSAASLDFWYVNPSWSGDIDDLVVYYRTDTTAAWSLLASFTEGTEDWTEADIVLPTVSSTVQIAFEGTDNYGYGVGIDEVTVAAPPSCIRPDNFRLLSATSTSLSLAWTPVGSSSSWNVEYSTSPINPGTEQGTVVVATDSTITLTELTPNTLYYIYLQTDCGTETSLYRNLAVRTECGATTLPLVEDFESVIAPGVPFCWQTMETYTSYGVTYPYVNEDYYNNGYAHSGYNYLYFVCDYPPQSIVSPRIPLGTNEIEVNFWGKCDYSTAELQIGYIDNPATPANFQLVQTITLSTTMSEYFVRFDTVSSTDTAYVVFRYNGAENYNSIYLDDIVIRPISSCSMPNPPVVSATTASTITLSWSDTNENNSDYDIAFGPMGFNPDTVETNIIPFVSDTTFTIEDLADSIDYDFYVRTNCGSEASYWRGPVNARPGLYKMPLSGTDTITACGAFLADDGGTTANFSNMADGYVVIYPSDPDSTVRVSGTLNSYWSYGTYYYGTLTIYDGVGTNGQVLGQYSGANVAIDDTASAGPLTIHFSGDYGYSQSSTAEGFLLQISCLEGVSCIAPYGLTMGGIVGTSATASWNYSGPEGPSFVAIVTDTLSGNVFTFTSDTTTIQLTGLDQLTTYRLQVGTFCGDGDTSLFISTYFKTKCISGGELTVAEGTESASTFPTYTYYNYSLSQQLYEASLFPAGLDTIYGIAFNRTDMNTYDYTRSIDIYLDTTSATSITHYTAQNPARRVFSGTVRYDRGWTTINFSTPFIYDGHSNILLTCADFTGSYVSAPTFAAQSTASSSVIYYYTDGAPLDPTASVFTPDANLLSSHNTIMLFTPCDDASCAAPNVALSNTDAHSIAINWIPGNNESAWSVDYRVSGVTEWTSAESSTTQTNATISGLDANTLYEIRVGSLCGDTTIYAVISARTTCAPIVQFPFTEDFENFTAPGSVSDFQPCWGHGPGLTSYGSTYYYPDVYDYESHSGSHSIELYTTDYPVEYFSYLILPEMGVPLDTLMVGFYLYMDEYTNAVDVAVGAMSDPSDTSTFVPIDTVHYPANGGTWEFVELELRNYHGNAHHIAFKSTTTSSFAVIDDIEVDIASNCIRPFNTRVDSTSFNQAFLSFSDSTLSGNYTIVYGSVNNIAAATDTVNVLDTVAVLSNLNSSSAYYAWVRSNCNPEVSRWVAFPTINTACDVAVIDATHSLYESFEGEFPLPCWNYAYADPNPSTSNLMSHSSDAAVAGQQCFRFSSMSLASNDDNTEYLISREISATEAVELSFSYKNSNTSEIFSVGYSVSSNDPSDFTWGDPIVASNNQWNRFESFFPDSTKYVAIRYSTDYQYYLYIDSFLVRKAPDCIRPDNLAVTTYGATTVTIGWNSLTAAPAFEVVYGETGSTPMPAITTTTNSVTLTGLTAVTAYDIKVRALCSDSDTSDWSNTLTFSTTICDGANVTATGNPTGTSYSAPVNAYYNYTLSQTIIDSAELNGRQALSAISYYFSYSSPLLVKTDVDIYLQPTSLSVFNSSSDIVALDTNTAVKVFSGALNCNQGWNIFPFDTTYEYDGNGNLLVIVDDNSGDYESSSYVFATTPADGYKTISYYDDSDNPDVNDPASFDGYNTNIYNWRPVMQLISCGDVCGTPVVTNVALDYESATISWAGDGDNYEIAIRTLDGTYGTPVAVSATSYTFNNLQPATNYLVQLRQDCNADSNGYSDWVEVPFTTDSLPCFTPTNVSYNNVTFNTAELTWNTMGEETAWEIHVFNTTFDNYYEVTTNPATADGLMAGTSYSAAVRALCGSEHNIAGEWSDTIQFTTDICDSVTNVQATANGISISLTWTAGENNCGIFEVECGEHGFGQGEGTTFTVNGTSKTFPGLYEQTTYDFYVRAVCAEGVTSAWSAVVSATTGTGEGIYDVEGNFNCNIFPNPASDETTISVSGVNGKVTIAVVDMNGRTVSSETLDCSADCVKKMNVSGLTQGAYFVRISGENVNSLKKLIIR